MDIFEHLEKIDETIETIRYEKKRAEIFNGLQEESDATIVISMGE